MADKTAPAKAKKEAKVAPVYNYDRKHKEVGRRVFTARGTGEILGYDSAANRFLVQVGDAEFNLTEKSVRFKAVDDKFREGYTVDRSIKTTKGAPSVHCGDDLAQALLGLSLEECQTVAKENSIDHSRWAHLNPGMQRMNIGNALRNMVRKELKVTVFGNTVANSAAIRTKQLAKERAATDKAAAEKKATREANAKEKKAKKAAKAKAA